MPHFSQVFVCFNFADSVGGHEVPSFSEVVLALVFTPIGESKFFWLQVIVCAKDCSHMLLAVSNLLLFYLLALQHGLNVLICIQSVLGCKHIADHLR
jgi:hypothetical protein